MVLCTLKSKQKSYDLCGTRSIIGQNSNGDFRNLRNETCFSFWPTGNPPTWTFVSRCPALPHRIWVLATPRPPWVPVRLPCDQWHPRIHQGVLHRWEKKEQKWDLWIWNLHCRATKKIILVAYQHINVCVYYVSQYMTILLSHKVSQAPLSVLLFTLFPVHAVPTWSGASGLGWDNFFSASARRAQRSVNDSWWYTIDYAACAGKFEDAFYIKVV